MDLSLDTDTHTHPHGYPCSLAYSLLTSGLDSTFPGSSLPASYGHPTVSRGPPSPAPVAERGDCLLHTAACPAPVPAVVIHPAPPSESWVSTSAATALSGREHSSPRLYHFPSSVGMLDTCLNTSHFTPFLHKCWTNFKTIRTDKLHKHCFYLPSLRLFTQIKRINSPPGFSFQRGTVNSAWGLC